jgi:GMP synthase (glutamine-hydrolysing)
MTIGGSALSVFYAIPRYRAFEGLLHRARASHNPIFGICFGAQALADAFGGKVIRDLKRAEYGTIDVACDEAAAKGDSLFARAPARFAAQAWHRDRIVRLPVDARPLAWSPDGALQAFCLPDESVWGVQFHPERDQETFQRLLETRADPPGRAVADIRASLRPSPEAAALLARFARLCASRP